MTKAKSDAAPDLGVSFPQGTTGSQLFAALLEETIAAFPGAFGSLHVPRGKEFRKQYAELVTQFEALRAASSSRAAIALFVARKQLEKFEMRGGGATRPLLESLDEHLEPLALTTGIGEALPQPIVEIPYLERVYRAGEVAALANELFARHGATRAAVSALSWIAERGGPDGKLDLRTESFAVLGASAEIAPTELLVRAGARVLWIDLKEPPEALRRANVQWVQGGADLLAAPARIARTLELFAQGKPIQVVACAYAPGRGREWRLTVAMNALVHKLPHELVGSLVMLLSPTSPAAAEPEDVEAVKERTAKAHLWQKALARTGFLSPPQFAVGQVSVVRSVVPIQGATYQAAQYAAKRLSAEAFAAYGAALDLGRPQPLVVSANVAPITRTRSLRHPLFEAGFLGAETFGVEIFDPPATRAIGLLLALHDLLNPASPARSPREPAQSGALFRQHVHGGIFGLPWALEPSITASAIVGLGRRPGILLKLFR